MTRPRVRIPPCPPAWADPCATGGARLLVAVAGALLLAAPGCVTRKLVIRSEPPGARVLLDGREVGTTPYAEDFISYGVRRVVLEHPDAGRLDAPLDLERPWWQYFPVDLFTDLVWPFEIRDERAFAFELPGRRGPPSTRADAEAAYLRLRAFAEEQAAPPTPGAPPTPDSPPDVPPAPDSPPDAEPGR